MGRHVPHEHLVAGLASALRAGALTANAVALEARKAAEADEVAAPVVPAEPERTNVTSLTERRLAQLPPDTRPLPSVAAYDQLLRVRQPADRPAIPSEPQKPAIRATTGCACAEHAKPGGGAS